MGCGGSKDQGPSHEARPGAPRSEGGQRQHQRVKTRAQNPPPAPPLPPASRAPPRSSPSQVQSSPPQSIPLQQMHRPGPSGRGDSNEDVVEAVQAVARCLNNTNIKYAIVGGAGLAALGSTRETDDVDFVVYPPSQLKAAKDELRKDSRFQIDPKTRHTTFTGSTGRRVEIEALSSPGTFKGRFDNSTQLMTVHEGVDIPLLNAPLYLESKCGSLPGRTNKRKRNTDASDIRFILQFMVDANIRTNHSEVPSATAAFLEWLNERYPGNMDLFRQVGLV